MKIFKGIAYLALTIFMAACDIKDDIPYPIVHGQITEFEVEGQCGADGGASYTTSIDKETRRITLFISDTVNLAKLKITKISVAGTTYNPDVNYTDEPQIIPDSASCISYQDFPRTGFNKPAAGQNTYVDFTHPVKFTIRTYQDYNWTVTVTQVVKREIEVENQIGDAVIDPHLHNAIIYVNREQSLRKIKVKKFILGGTRGTVSPDPTKVETYDFYDMRQFVVNTSWGETQMWNVAVYHTDEVIQTTATAFARNHSVTISGNKPNGVTPVIEYKATSESAWKTVDAKDIELKATTYTTTIGGLTESTDFNYKVTAGDSKVEDQTFSTAARQELPNSSFDDWSTDASNAKLYNPWAEGGTSFWDTGNRGATTVGNSNSVPTDDTSTGSGMAAYLESKWIVIKFAAGNIFTGTYLKTDGTNGVLGFGRPFTAFPTKMSFDYKYKSEEISKVGDDAYSYLKGRPDSCNIYVALWHIAEGEYEEFQGEKYPLIIRTKPGMEQNLFHTDDPRVIAYGQFTEGRTINNWTSETIDIKYKNTQLAPTHILVVASSSKYGDFFTGGVGSTLVLDNMKLIYD